MDCSITHEKVGMQVQPKPFIPRYSFTGALSILSRLVRVGLICESPEWMISVRLLLQY
jgi:hypothetical protein